MAIESLTQSLVNMYARCGHQVYLRYVKGIIIPPAVAARKGSSVHSSAEHDYRHKLNTGEYAPLDEVKDATRDKFMELVTEEGVWLNKDEEADKNTILNTALNESLSMAEFHHTKFAPVDDKIAFIEKRLTADIGLDLPLSGKPDYVLDGTIKDIKTSGKRWVKGREEEEIQAPMYKILLNKNGFGDLPFEFRIMTNMINGPKDVDCIWDNNLKVCGDVREGNNTPEYVESLKYRLKSISQMIKHGDFPPAYPGAWWCGSSWCGYFSICPYVKGRKIFT